MEVKSRDMKRLIKATFPDYRKRTLRIEPTTQVRFMDLNWSGGTRSEYRACTITGQSIENRVNMSGPAPWNNPFEGKIIDLPEGAVVVEGGYFCGKPRQLRVYVHPNDMPKMLTCYPQLA